MEENSRIKVFVSTTVYGVMNDVSTVCAILDGMGYDVINSAYGTLPVDSNKSAFQCCLDAVEDCDIFLGIIQPKYGSGRDTADSKSITHLEFEKAIELNKPRFFLVDYRVTFARLFLKELDKVIDNRSELYECLEGIKGTKSVDFQTVDMYNLAILNDSGKQPSERVGNWVQEFNSLETATRFIDAQFKDKERIKRMIK